MISQEDLKSLKIILREEEIPFFSDEELDFYYSKNKGVLMIQLMNAYR